MTQVHAQEVAPDATTELAGATAPAGGAPERPAADPAAGPVAAHSPLPLVAFVLGIAGVVLGVTVFWFFAAIPVGLVSILVGLVARGRMHSSPADPRASSRATIGIALGCVAILLGVTGAYFLPRMMDRADRFLNGIQHDVNQNVDLVNNGLTRDVDRLDRTLSRDLDKFERDNHRDVKDLELRTAVTMKALEERLNKDVDDSRASAKRDLATLESSLRSDLHTAQEELRTVDSSLREIVAALEARVARIEKKLGL